MLRNLQETARLPLFNQGFAHEKFPSIRDAYTWRIEPGEKNAEQKSIAAFSRQGMKHVRIGA
jgi:hypothetical protein